MKALKNASAAVMWACLFVGGILGAIHGFTNDCMVSVWVLFIFAGFLHLGADALAKYEEKVK